LNFRIKIWITPYLVLDGGGVDSSYNVPTNVSVRRGKFQGINVHSIHKGDVLLFLCVHLERLLIFLK
jgi:hypothetical protein